MPQLSGRRTRDLARWNGWPWYFLARPAQTPGQKADGNPQRQFCSTLNPMSPISATPDEQPSLLRYGPPTCRIPSLKARRILSPDGGGERSLIDVTPPHPTLWQRQTVRLAHYT